MNIFSQLFNFIFKVIMILTKSANYIASLFNLFLPSPSELYIHIIVEYFHICTSQETYLNMSSMQQRAKLISNYNSCQSPLLKQIITLKYVEIIFRGRTWLQQNSLTRFLIGLSSDKIPSILLITLCFVAKCDKLLIVFFLIVAIQRINKLCHTEHRFTADISLKFNLVRNISWEVLVANNFHELILNLEHAKHFSLFYLR